MTIQTNTELIAALQNIADNFKTVYMWGVFGAPVTEALIIQKTNQYPAWYTAARQAKFRALIGKGYFAFDCVNVIKALLWGWCGDSSKSYGGATYAANGVPDIDADTMITKCTGVSTGFSNLEVGEALWCAGHIGVYIGGGKAIECTPSWYDGVFVTAVKNIGLIDGLYARPWTKHGKLPYITYESEEETMTTVPEWQKEALQKLVDAGIILTPEYWENKLGYNITAGEVMGIMANMLGVLQK